MPFIYSTLSNPQSVVIYHAYPGAKNNDHSVGSQEASQRRHVIHINGGANVIDFALVTPRGVATEVEDSELAELMKNAQFKRWVERGFITVEKHEEDADHVADDMEARDASSQITTEDHESRFDSGETTSEVIVDDPKPDRKKRTPRKARPAAENKPENEE